jgi:polysaccharide pyruvyl transferase WcaK-like protein
MAAKPAMFSAATLRRIGVFGHFGNENLGDEATIVALLDGFRRRLPRTEFVALSVRPGDTAVRHGVTAYPIRRISAPGRQPVQPPSKNAQYEKAIDVGNHAVWERLTRILKSASLLKRPAASVRRILRSIWSGLSEIPFLFQAYGVLRKIDLLAVAGSNQFLDNFGGIWGFPYTVLKWTILARLARAKVVFLNVGAGPINSTISKRMFRFAVKLADYVSVRDEQSRQLLEALGITSQAVVYPDLVFGLSSNAVHEAIAAAEASSRAPIVGINPMPVYDQRYWCVADSVKYAYFVDQLTSFSASLLEDGCSLVFWSTQPSDQNVIADVIAKLRARAGTRFDSRWRIAHPSSVDQLLEVISGFDFAVATRFHGVVLSLFCGKPVLAICYHPKMHDLMFQAGQADYSVDFDSIDSRELRRRFESLRENRAHVAESICQRRNEFRQQLDSQFDFLFGQIEHSNEVGPQIRTIPEALSKW